MRDNLSLSIRCKTVIEALLSGVEVRLAPTSPERAFIMLADHELAELLPVFHLGLSPRREIMPQPSPMTLGDFVRYCEMLTEDQYLLICDRLVDKKHERVG